MGNEQTTPKPPTVHEDVVRIINANVQQTAHVQKTASAITVLAYVGVIFLIAALLYAAHRIITKYERMRTAELIRRNTVLNSVVSTTV